MTDISNERKKSRTVHHLHELIQKMSKDEQEALLIDLKKGVYKARRKYERKPFVETVDYNSDSQTYRDFIKDISYGGVFIETSNPFSAGKEISMTFLLPEHKKRLRVQGEVVRITKQGIGVKFKASQVQNEIIKSFVEKV